MTILVSDDNPVLEGIGKTWTETEPFPLGFTVGEIHRWWTVPELGVTFLALTFVSRDTILSSKNRRYLTPTIFTPITFCINDRTFKRKTPVYHTSSRFCLYRKVFGSRYQCVIRIHRR